MYKILVVDDEQIERDGVCFLLNKFKYPLEIKTGNNGKSALEYITENPVDIICSDIKMPFMNGLELCEQARLLYPNVKILLLTAYNDFEFAQKAIKVKVNDYILKPVVVEEFRDIMDQLVNDLDDMNKRRESWQLLFSRFKLFENMIKGEMPQELTDAADSKQDPQLSDKRLVKNVVSIVEREYTTDISMADISARMNFSRGYLSAVFKKETGMSCMQYITILRMQKAQKLLLQSNMRVNDIARAVGYNDISYFGLIFKRTFGMTPARFRNGGMEGEG